MENGKIVVGEHFEIESKIQNESRSILVSLPKGYEKTEFSYPVFFVLNGSWEMMHINCVSIINQKQRMQRTK